MPTSARTPAVSSFMRISMGWVKMARMPGKPSSSSDMAATRASWLDAWVQADRGCRVRKTSDSSVPMGSVATSAVPVRVQM